MIKSMTAFTRQQYQGEDCQFIWELRSVNHRYLDLSFSLPEHFRYIEAKASALAKKRLARGKIECYLHYKPLSSHQQSMSINQEMLASLELLQQQLQKQLPNLAPASTADMLNWPNMIHHDHQPLDDSKEQIITLFEQALLALLTIREQEGKKLAELIKSRIDKINMSLSSIKEKLPTIAEQQRQKITATVKEIAIDIEPNRLAQEIIFYAQKIDIAEEIERLQIHCQQIESLLQEDNNIGRRLDFLLQECQREANTIASKASDSEIVHYAIDIKVLVEQMREQAQNIE